MCFRLKPPGAVCRPGAPPSGACLEECWVSGSGCMSQVSLDSLPRRRSPFHDALSTITVILPCVSGWLAPGDPRELREQLRSLGPVTHTPWHAHFCAALTSRGFKGPVALRSRMPGHPSNSCTAIIPWPPWHLLPLRAWSARWLPPSSGLALGRQGPHPTLDHGLSHVPLRLFYEDLRSSMPEGMALQGGPISNASLKGQLRL